MIKKITKPKSFIVEYFDREYNETCRYLYLDGDYLMDYHDNSWELQLIIDVPEEVIDKITDELLR